MSGDSTATGRLSVDEDQDAAELFRRAQNGDAAARDDLFLRSRGLALYLARRFQGRGEPLDDLEQVASMALVKAVDRFDLDRGVKFSTFASVTIVGELKRHFRDTGWAMRVPRRLQELGLLVGQVAGELSQELGRSPTVAEIAEKAKVTEDDVLEALDSSQAYSTSSLDAPSGDDEGPWMDPGVPDESFELIEGWASIADDLRDLPARERQILYLRFFKNKSQTEIAEAIGISQMHVSRLLAKTLTTLRQAQADADPTAEEDH